MHFHGDNLSVDRHATLRPAPAAAAVGITARFHFDKWPPVSHSLRVTTMSPRYRSHRPSVLALAPARMVECRGRKRYRKLIAMSQLVVASNNPALSCPLRAHVAHDLRNLLATVGLHLDTLQRLSGPSSAKAANAAHALLTRGAALCNDALDRIAGADSRARDRPQDLGRRAMAV